MPNFFRINIPAWKIVNSGMRQIHFYICLHLCCLQKYSNIICRYASFFSLFFFAVKISPHVRLKVRVKEKENPAWCGSECRSVCGDGGVGWEVMWPVLVAMELSVGWGASTWELLHWRLNVLLLLDDLLQEQQKTLAQQSSEAQQVSATSPPPAPAAAAGWCHVVRRFLPSPVSFSGGI